MKTLKILVTLFLLQSCLGQKKINSNLSLSFSKNNNAQPGTCNADESQEKVIEGKLELSIIDRFDDDSSQDVYTILDEDNTRYHIENITPNSYSPGDKVKVIIDQTLDVKTGSFGSIVSAKSIQLISSPDNNLELKTYENKMLTLILDFNDRKTSNIYNETQAKKDMKDIADYYERVSGGQMKIDVDLDDDGETDVETVTMDRNFSRSDCTPNLAGAVSSKIQKYNLSDYTNIVYIAAKTKQGNDPVCRYGGVANVGSLGKGHGSTHIAIPLNSVTVHELGHNFGLGHSGQGRCTYCEQVDPMGNYFGNKFQAFNGPKSLQLGLFDQRQELQETITQSGEYRIGALGLGVVSSDSTSRVLSVPTGAGTYYVTYRYKVGEDLDLPSSLNKFKGVVINTGSITRGGKSDFKKVLSSVGSKYTVSSGEVIELSSGIDKETVDVKITLSSSGGGNGGSTCDSQRVISTFESINRLDQETFEVAYKVKNDGQRGCKNFRFNLSTDSKIFELTQSASISVNAGEEKSIITKLKIIDTDSFGEVDGNIIGTETSNQNGGFKLNFKVNLGQTPTPPKPPGC